GVWLLGFGVERVHLADEKLWSQIEGPIEGEGVDALTGLQQRSAGRPARGGAIERAIGSRIERTVAIGVSDVERAFGDEVRKPGEAPGALGEAIPRAEIREHERGADVDAHLSDLGEHRDASCHPGLPRTPTQCTSYPQVL